MVRYIVIGTFIVFHLLVHALASAAENDGIVRESPRTSAGGGPGAAALNSLVQDAHEKCSKDLSDSNVVDQTDNDAFDQCLDEFLQANAPRVEEAQQAYSRDNEVSQIKNYTTQTQLALREKLREKTNRTLRGTEEEIAQNGEKFVDHNTFFSLYESQLAKSVTLVINSYCMYADDQNYTVPKDETKRKTNKEKNFRKTTEPPNAQGVPALSSFIGSCMTRISEYCHNKPELDRIQPALAQDDKDYTNTQACLVTSQLRKLNKATKRTNDIRTALADKDKSYLSQDLQAFGIRFYRPNEVGSSIDNITSLTGADFADVVSRVESVAEQCEGQNINNLESNPICKGFLRPEDVDEELRGQLQVRAAIQTRGIASQLDKLSDERKDGDNNDFLDVLEVDGYTQAQIDEAESKGATEIQKMKQQLKKRYENERQALLREFNERINKRSGNNNGANPQSRNFVQEEKDKAKELNSLILFNNFVVGYLQTTDSNGNTSYNLSAIEQDIDRLEDSGVDFFADSGVREQAQAVFEQLKPQDDRSPAGSASSTIDSDKVNCGILRDYGNSLDSCKPKN